jgi:hypothetical protein
MRIGVQTATNWDRGRATAFAPSTTGANRAVRAPQRNRWPLFIGTSSTQVNATVPLRLKRDSIKAYWSIFASRTCLESVGAFLDELGTYSGPSLIPTIAALIVASLVDNLVHRYRFLLRAVVTGLSEPSGSRPLMRGARWLTRLLHSLHSLHSRGGAAAATGWHHFRSNSINEAFR